MMLHVSLEKTHQIFWSFALHAPMKGGGSI